MFDLNSMELFPGCFLSSVFWQLAPIFNAGLMGRNTIEYNHNYIICNKKALKENGQL